MSASNYSRPVPLSFLCLPLEIRHEIYGHLISGLKAEHSRLPQTHYVVWVLHPTLEPALLTVHSQITNEILDYYFGLATWKLGFRSQYVPLVLPSHQLELRKLMSNMSRLRHIEIMFYWHVAPPSQHSHRWNDYEIALQEVRQVTERACEILSHAPKLKSASISWIDKTRATNWAKQAWLLEPLRILSPNNIDCHLRKFEGCDNEGREQFIEMLRQVIGERTHSDTSSNAPGLLLNRTDNCF